MAHTILTTVYVAAAGLRPPFFLFVVVGTTAAVPLCVGRLPPPVPSAETGGSAKSGQRPPACVCTAVCIRRSIILLTLLYVLTYTAARLIDLYMCDGRHIITRTNYQAR